MACRVCPRATYSHANGYDSNYYADNPKLAYGPDQYNRNHAFIANVVYMLPFGRGQKYLSGVSRPANFLIGGWQLTQTLNWSGGLPWTASIGECGNISSGGFKVRTSAGRISSRPFFTRAFRVIPLPA
jgi:hypothetical protein